MSNRLNLDNTTLISIVGNPKHLKFTKIAMNHCLSQVDFKKTLLLYCEDDDEFDTRKIPYLDLAMYNQLCVEELTNYIETDFCLVVQWDGFIIDTNYWTEDFLNYDYIGSPWASWGFTVGNGGFSLRSKKYLDISSKKKYISNTHLQDKYKGHYFASGHVCPEDFYLCHMLKDEMVNDGIKFATPELAYQFSVEHQGIGRLPGHEDKGDWVCKTFHPMKLDTYKSFGFHGKFNVAGMKELLKYEH